MNDPKVTGEQTVSEIAGRSAAMRAILHGHGVDLCCGGVHPLAMAAQAHGVDLQAILDELNAAGADGRSIA